MFLLRRVVIKINNNEFVHLHINTEYSLQDSTSRLEELFKKAESLGMKFLSITDKNTISGVLRFQKLAAKYGINPVIGCEIEVSEAETLVLLAVNNRGYEKLVKWINSGSPFQPALAGEIIALSGGCTGAIYNCLRKGEDLLAEKLALKYVNWFGKGNFYLELQQYNSDDSILSRKTAELSEKTGIPLVATHSIKYIEPEDANDLNILKGRDKAREAAGRFYFTSGEEMLKKFSDYPEAIKNSSLIAERCIFDGTLKPTVLPHFPLPHNENEESFLRKICLEGLNTRFKFKALDGLQSHSIIEQLNHELDVIVKRGLVSYFLIVWDIVNFARNNNIPVGPGRGSSAGSLTAFLLGITQVNPVLHKLSFERFLSPDREQMPDIDLDVCQRGRAEILEYIKKKYGKDNVVHLGVLNTFGTRGAIRKAGAFLNLKKETDLIARLLPAFSGTGGIRHCLETLPELKKIPVDREPYRSLFYLAERIEGLPNNHSSHPSGILIGDGKLGSIIPITKRPDGNYMTTFNKEDIQQLGLLKLDLLGLRNLTVIEDTVKAVSRLTGIKIDVENIPMGDSETFKTIATGDTLGCFQLESMGIRYLMRKMQPKTLEELALLLALYRPGAWQNGIVETYLNRRNGKENVKFICPEMEAVLASTCGLIIYQEQVMEIANTIAGYSMGEADLLRRALTKRQADSLLLHRNRFISGAVKKGYTGEMACDIFDFLASFAGYSYNKAHSISYAYISYWTVYLKTHYPKEYMAALLSLEGGYYDKRVYIRESKKNGILLLAPDVNRSSVGYQPEEDGIRIGINMIKGCGVQTAEALLNCRKTYGKFASFEDFIYKMKLYHIKSSVLKLLINAGACDQFYNSREKMLALLDQSESNKSNAFLKDCSYENCPERDYSGQNYSNEDNSEKEKRKLEKELLGFSVQKFPQDKLDKFYKRYQIVSIKSLYDISCNKRVRISGTIIHLRRQPANNGEYLLCMVVQDHSEMVEVVVYPKVYKTFLYEFNPEGIIIEGVLRKEDMSLYVTAEKIKALGSRREK